MKKYIIMILSIIIITTTMVGCGAGEKTVEQQKENKSQQSQKVSNEKELKSGEVIGYMEMGYYWKSYSEGFHKMGINLKKDNPTLFTDLLKKGGFTVVSDNYTDDSKLMSEYEKANGGDTATSAMYDIFAISPNKEEVQFRFLFVSKLQFDSSHNQLITYEVQMLSPILNNGKMTDKIYKSWKVFDVIPTKSYAQTELEAINKRIKENKEQAATQKNNNQSNEN